MAEDEIVIIPKTFEELFKIYSNYKLNPLDIENEVYEAILLSQIDFWLAKSELLKVVFSTTDTGMAWMKFKKWRLDYDEFQDFLKDICTAKNLDIEEIKMQMTEAGPPMGEAEQPLGVK
ncbi:uncharacterized protein LOC129912595 [Episyrphus balteatus]|uniref:uncharacterized protein LOC129912595 n=1 Tax=Episyrphus balteatus TaxID=286459 RepID=UPI002485D570|nr:uncharacterized protein LOC129912595 [Episyrphus balteatus]